MAEHDYAAPIRRRYPLGMPHGSVRALLILMILGTIGILLLMPKEKNITVPIYMYYLLFLGSGAYFGTRGRASSREDSPLFLPRGTVRTVIVLGMLGVLGYALAQDPNGFLHRPLFGDEDKKTATILVPVTLIGAFLIGVGVTAVVHKIFATAEGGLPPWYQDIQAWIAVLAVLGLGAEVILELIVFPSMSSKPEVPQVQLVLSGIISFYFGARCSQKF